MRKQDHKSQQLLLGLKAVLVSIACLAGGLLTGHLHSQGVHIGWHPMHNMRCVMQLYLLIVGPRHFATAEQLTLFQLRWPHQEILAGNPIIDGHPRDCIGHRPVSPTPEFARGVRMQHAASAASDVVRAEALNLLLQEKQRRISNDGQQ